MIITADSIIKKRGDIVYEKAYSITDKKYKPLKSIVHLTLQNENGAFSTEEKCQERCNLMNQILNK